jgi:hypothetical protein
LPIAHRSCECYGFSFCARPPIPVAQLLAAFPHVALKVAFDKFYTTWLVKTQVAVAGAAHCFHSEIRNCSEITFAPMKKPLDVPKDSKEAFVL